MLIVIVILLILILFLPARWFKKKPSGPRYLPKPERKLKIVPKPPKE